MNEPENDPLQRASVSLLVHGDDLVPDELSAIMGVQPKIGVKKDETFIMSTGRPGWAVTASTGKWIIGTGNREPPNIDQQITELLVSLPDNMEIWADLTTRFACYISVGVYFSDDSWTGGFTLQPNTLRMLGDRGLPIDFDMYAPAASN